MDGNLHGSVSGVVGFIDWVQGLSAFRDGLGGRLVLCKDKYLSVFVVVCRWSGFVLLLHSPTLGNFLLDIFAFIICTCLGFARSLLGCFRVLFCRLFNWPFKGWVLHMPRDFISMRQGA